MFMPSTLYSWKAATGRCQNCWKFFKVASVFCTLTLRRPRWCHYSSLVSGANASCLMVSLWRKLAFVIETKHLNPLEEGVPSSSVCGLVGGRPVGKRQCSKFPFAIPKDQRWGSVGWSVRGFEEFESRWWKCKRCTMRRLKQRSSYIGWNVLVFLRRNPQRRSQLSDQVVWVHHQCELLCAQIEYTWRGR